MGPQVAAATVAVSKEFLSPASVTAGNLQSTAGQVPNNTVLQGDIATVRLGIGEVGGAISAGSITDALPAQLRLANPVNARFSTDCGGAAVASGSAGDGVFSASGLAVPAGDNAAPGRCYVYFDVVSTQVGNWTNTIAANGFTGTEAGVGVVANADPAPRNLTVTSLESLTVSKSFAPNNPVMGELSTLSIVIGNPNAGRMVGISQLTEQLPSNIEAAGAPTLTCTAGGTAGSVAASGSSGNVTLTFTGTRIAGSGSCTVSWQVRARPANGTQVNGTNTIPAGSVVNDRGLPSSLGTAAVNVRSPITFAKAFSPNPARAGEQVTLTFTIVNRSSTAVTAVGFDDSVLSSPVGLTLQSVPNASAGCGTPVLTGSVGASGITMSGAMIAAGATCTVTATVSGNAPAGYRYTNTVTGGATWTQGTDTHTTGNASATVDIFSGFRGFKSMRDPRTGAAIPNGVGVVPGDIVRFRVELENFADGQISGISLTDVLPAAGAAQLVFATSATASASNPATNCTPTATPTAVGPVGTPVTAQSDGAASVTFTGLVVPGNPGGNANPATRCYVEFDALVPSNWPAGTQISNNLPANAISGGGDFQNTVVSNTPVLNQFPITKAFAPPAVSAGATSVVTLTLVNNGFFDLVDVALDDPLPAIAAGATSAQLRVADPAGISTTCGGTPAYVISAARDRFQASGLRVPARVVGAQNGSCQVSFTVIAPAAGTYPNVATATGKDQRTGATVNPPGPANASLTATPSLTATKTFSPTPVAASGGISTVTVLLRNQGSITLSGVGVADPLPTHLTLADPPQASTTCAGPTVITAAAGGSSAQLAGARLAPDTTCTFRFNVVTNGATGTLTNTIPVGSVVADGGVVNTTPVTATLPTFSGGAVHVGKTFSVTDLQGLGQPTRLRLTISNLSTQALTGVVLADNLPAGMALTTSPNPTTSCGGTVSAPAEGSVLAFSGGTLAAGNGSLPAPAAAVCTIEADVTLLRVGTAANTIPAGAVSTDQGLSNSEAAVANLTALATIGVSKRFEPAAVSINSPSTLVITVLNSAGATFSNLQLVDPLPAGLQIAAPANAGTTCTNGSVSTRASTLGGGRTDVVLQGATLEGATGSTTRCEVRINVVAASTGAYQNTVPAGNVTADGVSNDAPAEATLNVRAAITVAKSFSETVRRINQPTRLTITLTNPNSAAVTNVALTDHYPSQVFNATTPNASTTCSNGIVTAVPSGSSLGLTGATLPASGSCTFSADVLANEPGVWNNQIPDGAVTSAEGISNLNPAAASFSTLDPPVLGKMFIPVQMLAGQTALLRIVIDNGNAVALTTTAALTDTLPTGLSLGAPAINTVATDPQGLPRCAGASGSSGVITLASGTTIPVGGCVILANVTSSVPGLYVNTIASGALQTQAGSNALPATATLAISTAASISGTVYRDDDNDGVHDAGERGLAGETIELLDAGGNVVATTTTDSLGNYAFVELPDGSYSLRQPGQPAGTLNGRSTVGTGAGSAGTASDTGSTPSQFTGITLVAGQNARDYNFGEILPSSLAGSVFLDRDNNGTRQSTDSALAGQTIQLVGTDDLGQPVQLSTLTDGNGQYRFEGLRPGNYTLTQPAQPAGTANGITSAGSGATSNGSASTVSVPQSTIGGIVLGTHQSGTGFNFAEVPLAGISGTVYIDRDRNNAFDPTDTGRIGGVTIRLVQGADCASGSTLQTTTTDAYGNYAFGNVAAGASYLLCQTQPAAWGNGNADGVAGSNSIAITNLPPGGLGGNNFGELGATVSGSVFVDANNDGARAGGDTGIPGVTLTLTGTDLDGNAVTRSITTDASGNYSFGDLPAAGAGGYTVTEQAAQPVAPGTSITTLNGRTTAGSTGGSATAVGVTPSAIGAIPLAAGATSSANLFAEILPVSLAGSVYYDADNNGQRAAGEVGVPGQTLVLTGTDDLGQNVERTLLTDAGGNFSATDLRPGVYTITQPDQPPGSVNGITTGGPTGGSATPTSITPSAVSGIDLRTPGASAPSNLFGELPTGGVVSGRVWTDANDNGSVDPGETGLAGVTIELTGTDLSGNPVTRSAVTDANGNYSFTGLPPGSYTLREPAQPAGTVNGRTLAGSTGGTASGLTTTPSTIAGITLAANQTSVNNNFGELPGASLRGSVYSDADNDGRRGAGEGGFGGQTIRLTGTDDLGQSVTLDTVTDANGDFAFTGLRPGSYTLTQPDQPADTIAGRTTAGTIGGVPTGTASPVTATPSTIAAITLPLGAASIDNWFGEIGNSPDVVVSKQAVGVFAINNRAEYRIVVANRGQIATNGVVTVEDRLPPGIRLDATPTGAGWNCVGASGATSFSCTTSAVISPAGGVAAIIAVPVLIGADALPAGVNTAVLNNATLVSGGGELPTYEPTPAERNTFTNNPGSLPECVGAAPYTQNACRAPATVLRTAAVGGTVWYDVGADRNRLDGADQRLAGWTVEIVDAEAQGTPVVRSTTTAADGTWRVEGLLPLHNYQVRFRDPDSGVTWAMPVSGEQGTPPAPCVPNNPGNAQRSSCVQSDTVAQLSIVLQPGDDLPQQSLPLDPGGVVYDATTRQPVPGSRVTLTPVGSCAGWDPAAHIVGGAGGGYVIDGSSISMTVGALGAYQFAFTQTAPSGCTFGLGVTPPGSHVFVSYMLPPESGALTPPPGSGGYDVQVQGGPPPIGQPTGYWLEFVGGPGRQAVVHNHLPVDPATLTGIVISKTAGVTEVELGDSVQYAILVRNTTAIPRPSIYIQDYLPPGFRYIDNTARIQRGGTVTALPDPDGRPGPSLRFALGQLPANGEITLYYRVRVGVGSQQGDGTNRARASVQPNVNCAAQPNLCSNESRWRIRVTAGVFTSDACFAGKIFVDCNHNHVQDAEELGIPGVRLWLQDGTYLISDSEGKYSYCGLPPRLAVLRVDPTTLPRGARLTTSSNRNAGDAGSLFLDLRNGELHRADFIEGSCSNPVLEQVRARRTQGEVSAPHTEKKGAPPLTFRGKAPGAPRQATDGADQQPATRPRPAGAEAVKETRDENKLPLWQLPMNQPPPTGSSTANDSTQGGRDAR